MSYYPNQQAVRWFLESIFPRVLERIPTATFIVVGASPPRWLRAYASDRVRVTGWVSDTRTYLDRARVVVAPLLIGGGTRVKILEAQAMARPVVSTSTGAEGLKLCDGESVLIADDAEAFASRVIDVLSDFHLALRLGKSGCFHVARHFNWDDVGQQISDLFESRIGLTARATRLAPAVAPPTERVA